MLVAYYGSNMRAVIRITDVGQVLLKFLDMGINVDSLIMKDN
jgi:hypothetical protein